MPVRFAAPQPGTLKNSAILIAVVLIPGTIASMVGGLNASVTVGLCCGAAMSFSTLVATRTALLITLALGAAAALGAAVAGNVWLSGIAVGLAIIATAPANMYSAGMLLMAPILTLVFAVTDRGWLWWQAGIWGVIGGLIGLGIALLMKFGQRPPEPMNSTLAWRHAVVLGIAAAVSIIVGELLELDHGYWITVTLMVVLRPVPGERRDYLNQRLAGTLVGAVIALITVWVLPENLLMVAGFVYLVILAAYAMSGNYFMQTMFLTPMLLLFISADSQAEVTVGLTFGRVVFTVIGAAIALVIALAMAKWDEKSGLLEPDEPQLARG